MSQSAGFLDLALEKLQYFLDLPSLVYLALTLVINFILIEVLSFVYENNILFFAVQIKWTLHLKRVVFTIDDNLRVFMKWSAKSATVTRTLKK